MLLTFIFTGEMPSICLRDLLNIAEIIKFRYIELRYIVIELAI